MESRSGISESSKVFEEVEVVGATSIVGMGTSAAATEARNCCVGAWRFDAFRLLTLRRGRGGDGCAGSSTVTGSGVVGASSLW